MYEITKKWKTVAALLASLFAIVYDVQWFWAVIIFIGLTHIIRSKSLHFVEVIKRAENPYLYWTMVGVLFVFGSYSALGYIFL